MKRRGFFSLFLPAAAVAQKLQINGPGTFSLGGTADITFVPDGATFLGDEVSETWGGSAPLASIEATPNCSWSCSCGAVMWPKEKLKDSPGTMRCMNGNCANFNVPFVIPTFTAYQQHTAIEKEKEEQQ